MAFFTRKTTLLAGLVAAATMVGVYGAAAGTSGPMPKVSEQHQTVPEPASASTYGQGNKVIRIVGPQFLPDNGDIHLLGAAEERARRP